MSASTSAALAALGEPVRAGPGPGDLDGLDGLIIPGGESTTLSLLLGVLGPVRAAGRRLAGGLPVFGTCAGMILLADEVLDGRPDQRQFGVIDLTVRRNGYGRQQASFECELEWPASGGAPCHAVFIRAPVVERAGPGGRGAGHAAGRQPADDARAGRWSAGRARCWSPLPPGADR